MRWLFDLIVLIGEIAMCGLLVLYLVPHSKVNSIKETEVIKKFDGERNDGGSRALSDDGDGTRRPSGAPLDMTTFLQPPLFCEKWVPGYWEPAMYWGMSGAYSASRRWILGFWKITECE